MVPIKIQCDCGQRYAFDVEPVNGRMPSPVTCPVCGADGTPAANELIQRLFPAASTVPAAPVFRMISPGNPAASTAPVPIPVPPPMEPQAAPVVAPVQITAPAPSIQLASRSATSGAHTPRVDPRLGLVDRTQAEHEARAKILWGDSEEQVVSYLLLQGFSYAEAQELVKELFKERTSAVRANGIRKLIIGLSLMCVPVGALVAFIAIGVISFQLMGMAVLVGLYGTYLALMGFLKAIAPKSEKGDAAQ